MKAIGYTQILQYLTMRQWFPNSPLSEKTGVEHHRYK